MLVGHVRRLCRRGRCRTLLADVLESVTRPDGTTQVLDPADRNAFSIFEDLCLLDNGEIRNSHNSSTFTRRLLSS